VGPASRQSVVAHPGLGASEAGTRSLSYAVLGISIVFTSNVDDALERIDGSYGSFAESPEPATEPLFVELLRHPDGETFTVRDTSSAERSWTSADAAMVDSLNRLTALVLAALHERRQILAVHAAAVVIRSGALIVAGRSGGGKTTLALGLVRRGLGLLSDELAVIETDTRLVLPYRRSLHIRPDTVELVPELGFLLGRPRHELGGGIEWALAPDELGDTLPGGLGAAAPLRFVLILDGLPDGSRSGAVTPISRAVAALELLRSTWKASVDFDGTLDAIVPLVADARCATLEVGALEPTLDAVVAWLEEEDRV